MHSHGNKNRTTPFIGNRETASQDKQRHKRGDVCMGSGEQQRAKYHPQETANIAFQNAIDEKAKNELLDDRCNRDREDNDHDSLADGARSTEELDDALLA